MKTILIFIAAMLVLWLVLSLSGCQARDVTIFSNTGSIASRPHVRPLPRQMTTRDLWNRGR